MMKLKFIISAIRRYGIGGVIAFFKRTVSNDPLNEYLSLKCANATPIPGITIVGHFDQSYSLSKVLRDFAIMLGKSGIRFQALNIPSEHPIPKYEYEHLLTPQDEFVTNRYTDIISICDVFKIPDRRCRFSVIKFWEFADGMTEAQPEILYLKSILALSDFNYDIYKLAAPAASVRKIIYPFQFNHGSLASIEETRKRFAIPQDSFALFFNFDYKSSYYRKNPEGILKSFSIAFSNCNRTCIVFKTMHAQECDTQNKKLHILAHELCISDRLITIDNFIPQDDLVNLTNACDAYISLHRGEGFGLGVAEAMTLGKPVIVTDYSGTTEFCDEDNSLLVPFKMVAVPSEQCDNSTYKYVTHWAEPDIDAAARQLRRLYDDPMLRQRLGEHAQKTICEHFSIENFKRSVLNFLRH